jgi:hypothetical protein
MRTERQPPDPQTGEVLSHDAVRNSNTARWPAAPQPRQPPIRQLFRAQLREWQHEAEHSAP